MKRKDQLTEYRSKDMKQLKGAISALKKQLNTISESKNIHAGREERRQLARLLTVTKEIEIISHE